MHGATARSWLTGDDLFDRIGAFLDDQGLSPDPSHYRFAYAVLSNPEGPTARAVQRMTDGGVRLTRRDIERLGGSVRTGAAHRAAPIEERADRLVAETQTQVDGFVDMVKTIHAETRDFGRELATSKAAIETASTVAAIDEIAGVVDAMMARVRDAEIQLARATEESDGLRARLAEAHDTARRDPLTGLPNRRAFEEAFVERDEMDAPWCLAVCDVDRFKRVNDEHGHGVGDRVLTAVGAALAEGCPGGLVARHGGEEFAILLAGQTLAAAEAMLDTVRAGIAARRFRNRDTDVALGRITVSAGVTLIAADEPIEVAFARADRLLYLAKAQGRDSVRAG